MKALIYNILVLVLLLLAIKVSASEYQRNGSGMIFSWQETDYVGVYTTGGTLVKYWPSAVNDNNATLKSGYGINGNTQYYAYSPYNDNNWDKAFTALPISYLNQSQVGNFSTEHLSAYDYQMASFTTGTGSANISFLHSGALLHFCWTLPIMAKPTRLALSCTDGKPFVTNATMDLTTQTITEVATTDTLSLALKVVTQSKGDVLNAYVMTAPVNLLGKTLTATLYTNAGDILTADVNGTNVLAGYIYPINIPSGKTTVIEHNNSKDSGSDSSTLSSKNSLVTNTITSTSSISSITAYSPDFTIDTAHSFTVGELTYDQGDVNKDGEINIVDAVMMIDYCLGKITEIDKSVADVNNDNVLDITDARLIINKCLGK